MNEAEAALGLLQLKYIETNILKRKVIYDLYNKAFKSKKYKIVNISKVSKI